MIRAAIFDFDGTLANTVSALREGINLTMQKYGYPEHTDEEIRMFIGNGARELVRRAMPADFRQDEAQVSRVLADYHGFYGTVYLHTDRLYDGLSDLLRFLDDGMGLRLGVLSNKNDAVLKNLVGQLLPDMPHVAVQGVLEGKPTKPHPYLAGLIADALGVKPEECVMIGDSDVDIRTAANAGMQHIGVAWGFRDENFLRENGAERIAHSPQELKRILLSLC